MKSDAERILALFESYPEAYGTHGKPVANPAKMGKLEIRTTGVTRRGKVNAALWGKHLSGKQPLGLFPIREDGTCMWGAIDVDDYSVSHAEVVERVKREGLPLVACRTKSGGLHLYAFFIRAIQAVELIKWLRSAAALLGFGSSEVFPKQAKVLWENGDFGSWLNMPYLGGDKTDRYSVNEKGKGLTLGQFLDTAEAARMDPDALPEVAAVKTKPTAKRTKNASGETVVSSSPGDPEFGDGPPCLETLTGRKLQAGERNNGLMALAVLAKKKYPDKWQVKLKEWAALYCDPSVEENDDGLKSVIKQNTVKAYNYQCRSQPIHGACNSPLCRTRRHGVGGGGQAGNMPKLSDLAVLNTDEPVWFLNVDDTRVMFSTSDLLGYAGFQAKVMEGTRCVPPMLKRDAWIDILQNLLENVVVIDAPLEVGVGGQFFEILEGLLTDRQQAQTKEELLLGKPWRDDETQRVYFRMKDLQEACERVRFRTMTRTRMVAKIKELGGTHDFFKLRGRGVNVWSVPENVLSRQTEPHETPELPEEVI